MPVLKSSESMAFLCSISSGSLCAAAWLQPGSTTCAVLGWASALLLLGAVRSSQRPYACLYLNGLIENAAGFYWLCHAIAVFGGFTPLATSLLYLLFVTLSSLQHLLFVFIYRQLPDWAEGLALRSPCAWVL